MGNTQVIQKMNYEDMQYIIHNKDHNIIINTLNENEQQCLIPNTINPTQEVEILNSLIKNNNKKIRIIVYGRNSNDEQIYKKYNQLNSLGFYNVFIYVGGMFEWVMLQDIYGEQEFPTTKRELDILKFKPNKMLNIPRLEY
jgi:rhodanese-related sulfurtransferase